MDKLPLELKQRICSFLHASPKSLKPIRLVSKEFASAAAPYLIPRLFLFRHPDSCAEVKEIAEHSLFSKYATTLVVDTSMLRYNKSFESWIDDHEELRSEYPSWSEIKPQGIAYDEEGDPILDISSSRARWKKAHMLFDEIVEEVTQSLRESFEEYWEAQQDLIVSSQMNSRFEKRFWQTVAYAFKLCPNLTNLVIAPPHKHERFTHTRDKVFQAVLANHNSFVAAANHVPPTFGLKEILQAADHLKDGLNSLTIVDLPIECPLSSTLGGSRSFESLKHIRIGYNRLHYNPKTAFDFNLEGVLHAAKSLETFWVEMPPRRQEVFDADDLLASISSQCFRDILLNNVTISEDSLVEFLLRHANSLQQLDLGVILSSGSWITALRRISNQMKVLKRVQFINILEIQNSERVELSPEWCSLARDFIINGGELPEPVVCDEDNELELVQVIPSMRRIRVSEKGLWREYDCNANVIF